MLATLIAFPFKTDGTWGGLIRYNLEQLTTTNPTNRTNNPGGFLATYIRSIRAIRGQNLPRFGYFKVPTVKSVGLPIESLVGLTNAWLQKQG